ncbi:hypothetical protein [Mucilaginibacter sp.]|uniref:hypothetical protein n=1 Tax=Mucilaginibacter sp. TaxID=1882438 RepID=UPI0025E29ECF|nr:hypothetical protein [Mucilaginibacter sp.]
MNLIHKIRADIQNDFNQDTFNKGDTETSISPSKKFRLEATNFWSNEPNWNLTKVEIYDQARNDKIFDFFINEDQFFYDWMLTNGLEYLICAEDIFGGQTIVDLTNLRMAGYSPNEDGFIWTNFSLSPDGKTLATIGCYWACPYVIKLFDFSNPLILPLREIKEIMLAANDEVILGWLDNETLKTKGIERESIREYDDDGAFTTRTISETPFEREIKIME